MPTVVVKEPVVVLIVRCGVIDETTLLYVLYCVCVCVCGH